MFQLRYVCLKTMLNNLKICAPVKTGNHLKDTHTLNVLGVRTPRYPWFPKPRAELKISGIKLRNLDLICFDTLRFKHFHHTSSVWQFPHTLIQILYITQHAPSVSFFHLSQLFNCFWEFLLCVVIFYKNVTLSFSADNVMRCQNSNVKLKCLNKSFILVITSVFYGRTQPGSIICPSPPRSHLSDEIVCNRQQNDVSDEVKQMCNEKISCNFTVRKQTFGKDGCPSIFKYIIIDYKCGKFGFFGMVYWCW